MPRAFNFIPHCPRPIRFCNELFLWVQCLMDCRSDVEDKTGAFSTISTIQMFIYTIGCSSTLLTVSQNRMRNYGEVFTVWYLQYSEPRFHFIPTLREQKLVYYFLLPGFILLNPTTPQSETTVYPVPAFFGEQLVLWASRSIVPAACEYISDGLPPFLEQASFPLLARTVCQHLLDEPITFVIYRSATNYRVQNPSGAERVRRMP